MAICSSRDQDLNPPARFLAALSRQAEALAGQAHAIHGFRIGEASLRVDFCAPGGSQCLKALPAAQALHADWRIFAWDGTGPERMPPERPWDDSAHEPLGIIQSFSDERQRCAYDIHTRSLIAADLVNRRAFMWYPDLGALPPWAMASPFRIPISWALAAQGQQMLHGAAITHKGSAALLCGNGGAGKSTTALAAALHGFGYVGDDYVAVDSVSRRVSLIYRTAKLLPATLAMLPRLAPLICNRDRMDREKGVLFLDGTQWELVPSAPLKCLLLPRIAQEGEPRVSPASRAEAIQALLPSTVGGLMGGTSATAGHMLRLASSLPALHLHLTPDIGALMVLLRQTLERYS